MTKQKVIAYLRVSSDKQEVEHQELEIRRYADKKNMTISSIIAVNVSSRKDTVRRRIEELVEKLEIGDTLIVTEISRLGRSTSEVVQFISELLNKQVRLIAIKQQLDLSQHDMQSKIMITLFSLLAELERDLISLRTKEALASKKAKGIQLGKPKGTLQKSKFDTHLEQIKQWLRDGVSVRKMSKHLGCNNHIGLNNYINSRKIKEQL